MTPVIDIAVSNDVFVKLSEELIFIKALALNVDFKNNVDRKTFFDAVISIKQRYKEAKALLTYKPIDATLPPAFRTTITHTIRPMQMDGWIDKLVSNFDDFIKMNVLDTKARIEFIDQQHSLIDIVVKVVNGDAYFAGCKQPT